MTPPQLRAGHSLHMRRVRLDNQSLRLPIAVQPRLPFGSRWAFVRVRVERQDEADPVGHDDGDGGGVVGGVAAGVVAEVGCGRVC